MTIHGSKSEFKQLRYLENCVGHVSLLPEAITFYPTIDFQFLQCSRNQTSIPFQGNQYHLNHSPRRPPNMQSKLDKKKKKIADVNVPKLVHPKGPSSLRNNAKQYKHPQTTEILEKEKNEFQAFWSIFWAVSLFLSKSYPKHTQKPFISHFSHQFRGNVLALIFLSLVFVPWI